MVGKQITKEMLDVLQTIHDSHNNDYDIGFVGGSDLEKQKEQLLESNFYLFSWKFSENGLLSFHHDTCIHKKSFVETIGEEAMNFLINTCLSELAKITLPKKRGTFIEFRTSMLNISPIGRSCSQEERDAFEKYDAIHKIRESLLQKIRASWQEYIQDTDLPELTISIGGQISMDIFPKGLDKTYCLQFVEGIYDEIHFFGDKTDIGGNDYEIFHDSRVIGHKVTQYTDTIQALQQLCGL